MADNRHAGAHMGADHTAKWTDGERRAHKALCVLSYLPFLCFVPLFLSRDGYVRFHTNQGLSLFVTMLITNAVVLLIGFLLGLLLSLLAPVFYILALLLDVAFLLLILIGVYHALTGTARELPVVGQARILK